jgi:hypothetical protein
MEIIYEGDGFKIHHQGRDLFVQNGPVDGTTWTQAEKEAAAAQVFAGFMDSMVKPNYLTKAKYIYNNLYNRPFTDSNNRTWVNGFDSVMKLDAARRLAIENSLPDITFYDVDKTAHVLTIAEATAVVTELGIQLQEILGKKNAIINSIKAASTEADLSAIDMETIYGIDPTDPMFM